MQKKKISEILSGGEGISMGGIRRTGRKLKSRRAFIWRSERDREQVLFLCKK